MINEIKVIGLGKKSLRFEKFDTQFVNKIIAEHNGLIKNRIFHKNLV